MSLPSFVTEKEIEEQKKRRQEEWEKVRSADQPKEAPEPEQDNRSLYERLKEQRDKKQYELDETQKLSLDSEEVGFLDFVDNMKMAEEKKRRLEERQLLEELHKTLQTDVVVAEETLPSSSSSTSAVGAKTAATAKPKMPSKQAQLIGSAIKRKSNDKVDVKNDTPEKRSKLSEPVDGNVSCESKIARSSNAETNVVATVSVPGHVVSSVRPSAMYAVGGLPSALGAYCGDSDDSSNEESDSSSSDNTVSVSMSTQKIGQALRQNSSAECSDKLKRSGSSTGSGTA